MNQWEHDHVANINGFNNIKITDEIRKNDYNIIVSAIIQKFQTKKLKIVELGCCNGGIIRRLLDFMPNGIEYCGFDINQVCIDTAISWSSQYKDIKFKKFDVEQQEFWNNLETDADLCIIDHLLGIVNDPEKLFINASHFKSILVYEPTSATILNNNNEYITKEVTWGGMGGKSPKNYFSAEFFNKMQTKSDMALLDADLFIKFYKMKVKKLPKEKPEQQIEVYSQYDFSESEQDLKQKPKRKTQQT